MRILEACLARTWRGGERQTLYNMLGFREAGVEVELLCRAGYPLEQKAREAGFTVHAVSSLPGAIGFLTTKGSRYDVMHSQTSHILTYCLATKPFHSAKQVFTRRIDHVPSGTITRWKYRNTDKIIAISEAIKRIVDDFAGIDTELVSEIVIPKQLDKQRAQQIIAPYAAQGKQIVGTTAALVQHKDPLTMVEAIKLLSQKRNDFVFLHFGAGELEGIVREKIKELGTEELHRMMGFIDNVEDIFSMFDVFVMSSEEEGLGSSVLDAFMYRVPVVSTRAGGLPDLVKDGRGILCDIKAPDQIAAAIDELLNNAEKKKEITDRAYQHAIDAHGLKKITDEYLRVFRAL